MDRSHVHSQGAQQTAVCGSSQCKGSLQLAQGRLEKEEKTLPQRAHSFSKMHCWSYPTQSMEMTPPSSSHRPNQKKLIKGDANFYYIIIEIIP